MKSLLYGVGTLLLGTIIIAVMSSILGGSGSIDSSYLSVIVIVFAILFLASTIVFCTYKILHTIENRDKN